ncbi:MAG: hypothetical protein NVV62_07670 [Terricaulis sp.]|nr:hypothetical protein [Terricaulis sp.]
MSGNERQGYKIAGPATWELIRAAYLAGESAPALAARFGVSEAAIRKRITVEKWSKRAYAAALEARGIEAPKREPLNVAARFAAHYAPAPLPPPEAHPFADLVDALKSATQAAESARVEEAPPTETPEQLERRALAQAGAALAKGRASDAKAFAALAEQMRKRVELAGAEQAQAKEAARVAQEEAEELIVTMFGKAAYLANAMVHAPNQAPAAFQGLVKLWREHNLGEGKRTPKLRRRNWRRRMRLGSMGALKTRCPIMCARKPPQRGRRGARIWRASR